MIEKRRILVAVPAVSAVLLAGVWFDLLPGGWTLRGWVQPHEPQARAVAAHRARRLTEFERENPSAPPAAVLFLGSSTIERFPLASSFPGVPCIDRGIGSEPAPLLLQRLERSLPPTPPAGAVLYVASIDFRVHRSTPARIAALAGQVIDELRERYPGLPLALIGILPERDMAPDMVQRLAAANEALAVLCAGRDCAFVRTDRPPVTDDTGSLAAAFSADRLHLSPEGYRHLAGWLVDEGGELGRLLAP